MGEALFVKVIVNVRLFFNQKFSPFEDGVDLVREAPPPFSVLGG